MKEWRGDPFAFVKQPERIQTSFKKLFLAITFLLLGGACFYCLTVDSPERELMGLFDKLFKKEQKQPSPTVSQDSSQDPKMIKVYDEFGREMHITRADWIDSVLKGNIKENWNSPDELYTIICQSLQDEFFDEISDAAEQLHKIDPMPARSATILGIVYMKTGRIDEAERILKDYIKKHGEDGVILTNLAKVYAEREDHAKAEETLFHALELDPNQDNGLLWYEAICRERTGQKGSITALQRIAALPGSWRAHLWLARTSLEDKDAATAKKLYTESLSRCGKPAPEDALMQISGDLGNNGYLQEIIELVEPLFDIEVHGLTVGNNLIKAYLDLGNHDKAKVILDKLYALKRPDWKQNLEYWDTTIAQARLDSDTIVTTENPKAGLMAIVGPLWTRDKSPFLELLTPKSDKSPKLAIFGGIVTYNEPPTAVQHQLADTPGRISRAVPLMLAESLHLESTADARALLLWMEGKGFGVMGKPYAGKDLCLIGSKGDDKPAEYMAGFIVDQRPEDLMLILELYRTEDASKIGQVQVIVEPQDPGNGTLLLIDDFKKLLYDKTNVRKQAAPEWYVPPTNQMSDYLLRLEQQLAVCCSNWYKEPHSISGEHEIIDGALGLCLANPQSASARMLLAQTVKQMRILRPSMMPEYNHKIQKLQEQHPLSGKTGDLIEKALASGSK